MTASGSIAPADRKLLWWGGVIGLVLVAGTFALSPSSDPDSSAVPTTYSSGAGGARAAYLLLLDLGFDIHRWEQPPNGLEVLADNAILILADPTQTPAKGEQASLQRFVRSGGRILFCGAALPKFFPEIELPTQMAGAPWTEFSSTLPSPYTRNADKVVIQPEAYGPSEANNPHLTLYGDEARQVVVLWRMGKGQILWWAGATPLTNTGIREAANLNLFLNSVSNNGGRTIYWDEYFHGARGSFWTYFANTPVGWGGLQFLILAVALLFTFSRRSGPIAVPAVVSRLSPLEFVDTMAGLYQKAGAAPIAVGVAYRHLRLELAQRLGLPPSNSDPALAQAAVERLGRDAYGLEDALAKASAVAGSRKLPGREALALVKILQHYTLCLTGQKSASASHNTQTTQEKI